MGETSLEEELQATDVADYLRAHPRFLQTCPDLALALEVPREKGAVTSLAGYQLDALREKNRKLDQRLSQLVATASDNEQLMLRVHAFTISLLRAADAAAVVRSVVAGMTEDFHTDLVRLVLFRPIADLPQADWLISVPEGPAGLPGFAEVLEREEPLVGRLTPPRRDFLFGTQSGSVQSSALVRLGGAGLLVIASTDADRFHPGMGGAFLKWIGEAIGAALERYPAE